MTDDEKKKTALIFGISGQDGSYLSEFLLSKGYKVRGVIRRASSPNTERIDHLDVHPEDDDESPFIVVYGDLTDGSTIRTAIQRFQPDEIYNVGAQSHVGISFKNPTSTIDINALGVLRILEAIKEVKPDCKYYQASSSEMFGISPPPQNEETPMLPQSPYGIAKLAAYHLTRLYRNAYGLHACNGILFNHESPRRGLNFVTRKVTRGIADLIITGKREKNKLTFGNLDATRDWGFSGEYVEAMWMIMQHDTPDDFVVSTEETHSIKDFLREAFGMLGLNYEDWVDCDDRYKRPADVPALLGDSSKAKRVLGWDPKVKFKELCKMMLEEDLKDRGKHYLGKEVSFDEAVEMAKNLKPENTS